MPYVQQADIVVDIPPDFLTQALDDNGDGVADTGLWDQIAQLVSDEIDAQIGVRYQVPLVPNTGTYPLTNGFPPIVVNAARVLACEKLYGRRSIGEGRNPWTSRANATRTQLAAIGAGNFPLDPAENRKDPSASVVAGRMQTASHSRLML